MKKFSIALCLVLAIAMQTAQTKRGEAQEIPPQRVLGIVGGNADQDLEFAATLVDRTCQGCTVDPTCSFVGKLVVRDLSGSARATQTHDLVLTSANNAVVVTSSFPSGTPLRATVSLSLQVSESTGNCSFASGLNIVNRGTGATEAAIAIPNLIEARKHGNE